MTSTKAIVTTIFILVLAASAPAAELHVPDEYPTIQAAIDAAYDGDTVIVADGRYTGEGNRDIDFLGKAITVKSESGPENCIIDCNGSAFDFHRGFYFHSGEDGNSLVEGFTITGGRAYCGGAIYCEESSPRIENCIIADNWGANVHGHGGGVCCFQSSATITKCVITNNRAGRSGGGIFCQRGAPTMTKCTIRENSAEYGGGLNCSVSNLTIRNCAIVGNAGGGIRFSGGNLEVTNCTINKNTAYYGIGIQMFSGIAAVRNCILWGNTYQIRAATTQVSVTYNDVEGGWEGEGNIDADPMLTVDGHLQAGSPCIDGGDPNGSFIGQVDIDGEARVVGSRIDIGCDEFLDVDVDGMADWWESKYFGSTTVVEADADADADSYTNLTEYVHSSDPTVGSTTYYVDASQMDDAGDGLSWDTAKRSIQAGINASENCGDRVIIAEGVYTGAGNYNLDCRGRLIIIQSTEPNDPDIVAGTVIDPNRKGPGFYFHNSETTRCSISGLTITNGLGIEEHIEGRWTCRGGGIFCERGSPSIINCVITGNDAWDRGGGIYCVNGSNPAIVNCTIAMNWARIGSGIHCEASGPTISKCVIGGNRIPRTYGPPYMPNGGIYCLGSSPTITECIISDNDGGIGCEYGSSPMISNCTITENEYSGIQCEESSLTVRNCTVSENEDHGIFLDGGGLEATDCVIAGNTDSGVRGGGATATITNCIITDNAATFWGGGGIRWSGGTVTITNCVISDNRAEWGGGIACYDADLIMQSCVAKDNTVQSPYAYGGAILCNSGSQKITNCTISGNKADYGGAIAVWDANAVMANCILWENEAGEGAELYLAEDSNAVVRFTDVQGGQDDVYIASGCTLDWGAGNIDLDPDFAFDSDFHLVADSPCIDTGDPNYGAEPNDTDLDANPRIMGGRVDMGAYEFMPASSTIAVSTKAVSFHYFQDWVVPEAAKVLVRNCGGRTLNWRISEDCDWVRAEPAHGVSGGEIDEVKLVVEPNSLAVGLYSCELEVSGKNTTNSPVTIDVNLRVGRTLRVPEDFATIQEAVDASEDFDMVLVSDGTYTGQDNRKVRVFDKSIVIRSKNGPDNCIIDYEGFENSFYLDCEYGETSQPVIDGLSIINGGAISTGWCDVTIANCIVTNGGGIYCGSRKATITNCVVSGGKGIRCTETEAIIANCTIMGNSGWYCSGGGIYSHGAKLSITNCTISRNEGGGILSYGNLTIANCRVSNNSSTEPGGGIYCSGELAITDCTISNNSTTGPGGGIYCVDGDVRVDMCTISGNRSHAEGDPAGVIRGGGGVYCEDASLTIKDTTMADNSADGNFSGGGAILCRGSTAVEVIDCTIRGNSAKTGGGGFLCVDGAVATITGCRIIGNSSEGSGGGISCSSDTQSKIHNCLVTGNSAKYAGGICCCSNERADITNCTIANNIARDGYGGGIVIMPRRCEAALDNCILWGNSAEDGNQIALAACPCSGRCRLTANYCNIEDGPEGVYASGFGHWELDWDNGNIDADPCFVEAGYWNASGVWVDGDYRLLPTSPCIDTGDPNYMPEANETDLDGNLRVIDGDDDGTAVVDMGAYEYVPRPPVQAEMKLTPQTLNCAAMGKYIKAHIVLPKGILPEDVDMNTPAVAEPPDIDSEYIKILGGDTGPVRLEIAFDRPAFCDALTETGEIEITVTGFLTTGQYFYATDTIKTKAQRPHRRAH